MIMGDVNKFEHGGPIVKVHAVGEDMIKIHMVVVFYVTIHLGT